MLLTNNESEFIEQPFSTSHIYWSLSCHAEGMLRLMRTISFQTSTEADVSFFSTLGCSLRGALTTGSMALALLSPFIWSERALGAVPVCRWLSFYLASPLSLSSPDSWLPQPAAARRQVLGLQKHASPQQTHLCNKRLWCIWILTPCTHFFFSFWLSLPPLSCLSQPLLFSVWGFQPLPLVSGVRNEQIIYLEGNQLWTRNSLTSVTTRDPMYNHFCCCSDAGCLWNFGYNRKHKPVSKGI